LAKANPMKHVVYDVHRGRYLTWPTVGAMLPGRGRGVRRGPAGNLLGSS
jgi:hypothetical protein